MKMTRRLDVRHLILLAVPTILLGVGVHALHGVQVGRSAALYLKKADRAEARRDLDEAESCLSRYLAFEPGDGEAMARYASLIATRAEAPEQFMRAFLALEQALRLDPGRRDIRRKAVDIALNDGMARFSDARAHLNVLLGRSVPEPAGKTGAATPEAGELESLYGRCREGEGKYEEAARWYAAAIEHTPGQIDAYVRLADLKRVRLDDPEGADRVMDAVEVKGGIVAANGESSRAYLERGRYRRAHGLEGADRDVARALELAPEEPDVLLAAAELALAAKDFGTARRHLARGVELRPKDGRMYGALAVVELQAGQAGDAEGSPRRGIEEAEASLRRGVETLPEGEERGRLLWSLAGVLIDGGKFDDARRAIERMGREDFRPELLKYLSARVLVGEGRWLEASRALEEARTLLLPERPELAHQADILLGRSYERLGEADGRLAAYQRAVAFDPLGVGGRVGLAEAEAAMGQVDRAIESYQQVVDRAPAAQVGLARLLIARNLRLPEPRRSWAEVDRALDGAAAALPDAIEVPIFRAGVLDAKGQDRAARDLLGRARDRWPDRVEPWLALAELEGRGGTGGASAVLDRAEEALGDRVELRLARGRDLARRGGEEARRALERLADDLEGFDDDDRRRLLRGLADLHRQAGDPDGARGLLGSLAERQPEDLGLKLARFDLAIQAGDEAAMKQTLGEIEALEKKLLGEGGTAWRTNQARYLVWRATRPGRADVDRESLEEARRLLTEVGESRPSWPRIPLALGEVADRLGDVEGAIQGFLRAIELGERRPEAGRRAVELLVAKRRLEEAGGVIEKFQEADPDLQGDPQLRRLAVLLALKAGDSARALELARKAVAPDSKEPRDLLWLAEVSWEAGQRAEVEPVLRRALTLDDRAPAAWETWVRFLVGMNRREEAEAAIKEAQAKLPKDRAPLALARCYAAVGRTDQAREQYRLVLADRPDDVEAIRGAAALELGAGQLGAAEPHLRALLGLQTAPPDATAWAREVLAILLSVRGGGPGAKEALKLIGMEGDPSKFRPGTGETDDQLRAKAKVLALHPGRSSRLAAIRALEVLVGRGAPGADDRFLLAQLSANERDWPKYREQIQYLLGEQGEDPLYLAHYTRCLLAMGDADGANFWLDKLERQAPEAFDVVALRASVLAAQGRDAGAVEMLRAYVRGKDDQVRRVAALLEQMGQAAAAEEMYRRYVSLGRRPEDVLALAGFLARQGRTREALDLCDRAWETCSPEVASNASVQVLHAATSSSDPDQLERAGRRIEAAIAKAPDKIALRFDLANVRILQGRDADAEAIFRAVHERDRTNGAPLNNLAWLLAVRGGKGDEALACAQRAIALDGERPDYVDTRALAYLATGRPKDAIRDLEDALAAAPDNAEMRFHLARAYRAAGRDGDASRAFRDAKDSGLEGAKLHPLERGDYDRLAGELEGRAAASAGNPGK